MRNPPDEISCVGFDAPGIVSVSITTHQNELFTLNNGHVGLGSHYVYVRKRDSGTH